MVTHSSILARKIPWAEEPGSSMGSERVGHDLATTQQQISIRFKIVINCISTQQKSAYSLSFEANMNFSYLARPPTQHLL